MIFKYIFSVSTPVLMILLKTTVKVKVISTRVHTLFVTLNSMTFHDFQLPKMSNSMTLLAIL